MHAQRERERGSERGRGRGRDIEEAVVIWPRIATVE